VSTTLLFALGPCAIGFFCCSPVPCSFIKLVPPYYGGLLCRLQGVRSGFWDYGSAGLKPQDYFKRPGMFDNGMSVMNAVCCSLEASEPEKGLFGCGAHIDFGMCTLLATSSAGLHVYTKKKKKKKKCMSV